MNVAPWDSPYPLPKDLLQAGSTWHLVNSTTDLAKPAYIDGLNGQSISYGELRSRTKRLAHALLHKVCLKPGQVVCIIASNSLLYPAFVHATQAAKLICTFANPAFTSTELHHVISDSDVQLIVTEPQLVEVAKIAATKQRLPHDRIFMLSEQGRKGVRSIWSLTGSQELEPTPMTPQQAKETTALRCYSSGTTGLPKGVNLYVASSRREGCRKSNSSHLNFHCVVRQLSATLPDHYTSDARWICFIPLFVCGFPLMASIRVFEFLSAWLGATSVILPKFEFETYLQLIEKYRITMAHCVPPIALLLAKSPQVDKYNLSSLKLMRCGAAPLSKDLQEAVEKRLGVRCVGAYGMTETTGGGCSDTPEHRKVGGNGPLLPGMQAQIVDGEMWFRGPNIMLGYHNNTQADKEAFSDDGWLRSGDIVIKDEDGHVFVTDRMKELIKYNGFQVAPAELEHLLVSRPDVADVGVVPALRALEATEVPLAYIVLTDKSGACEAKAREIISWAAQRTAPYKKLRGGIVFLDEIPKNASGKLLRRQLKLRQDVICIRIRTSDDQGSIC